MSIIHDPQSIDAALAHLRAWLGEADATGPNGFEGLLVECLEALTGIPFRLARSGSQFGRDGSSAPHELFGIAVEAKRFREPPSLQDVGGKAVLGGYALEGVVDLWAVGATAALGDDTVLRSTEILERFGMSLLVVDWGTHSLPRLAALVAATEDASVAWWGRATRPVAVLRLREVLARVRTHPEYATTVEGLRGECGRSLVGLGALRARAAEWLEERLRSRRSSRESFGQHLDVCAAGVLTVARQGPLAALSAAVRLAADASCEESGREHPPVILIEGEEGSGKSWLIASWWAAESVDSRPICLFVSGLRARLLAEVGATQCVAALAQLLAAQDGSADPARVGQWVRRLARWQLHGPARHPRFILVVDGLNEHAHAPWGDLLPSVALIARQLGGICAATTRPDFFARHVARKVQGHARIIPVSLGPYTDAELDTLLTAATIDPRTVARPLREFMRVPRVAAVALRVAGRLSLDASELTKERLLWEYWKHREEERGNQLVHTDEDFARLIASHATAWMQAQPENSGTRKAAFEQRAPVSSARVPSAPAFVPFDLDDWAKHSGVARREGLVRVGNDITEVAEGRFLQPVRGRPGHYAFRPDALPFALGVWTMREVRSEIDRAPDSVQLPELLDQAVEAALAPVRGFDLVSEIVAAAFGLACLEPAYPDEGRRALLRAWCGLQNVSAIAEDAMLAYVRIAPDVFLDVIEDAAQGGERMLSRPLLSFVRRALKHPTVAPAVDARIVSWLPSWTRRTGTSDVAGRGARDSARRDELLAALSPLESQTVAQLTCERDQSQVHALTSTAIRLMAGRPLACFADAMLGWTLACWLSPDLTTHASDLAWVLRANEHDAPHLEEAVMRRARDLTGLAARDQTSTAPWILGACAHLLRLTGGSRASTYADQLAPQEAKAGRQLAVDAYKTDPYNPLSRPGDRVSRAVQGLQTFTPSTLWSDQCATRDDLSLEDALPHLVRFAPAALVQLLRGVLRSTPERSWAELRSFALTLPWLAALVDPESASALGAAADALATGRIAAPSAVGQSEQDVVVMCVTSVALIRQSQMTQVRMLQALPSSVSAYVDLYTYLEPLSTEVIDGALSAAETSEDLRWVLAAAGAHFVSLSDSARHRVQALLVEAEPSVAPFAASVVAAAQDAALDSLLLSCVHAPDAAWTKLTTDDLVSNAVTTVVCRAPHTQESIRLIRADVLPQVLDELGPLGAECADAIVRRLMQDGLAAANPTDVPTVRFGGRKTASDAHQRWLEFPPFELLRSFAERNGSEVGLWLEHLLDASHPLRWLESGVFAAVLAAGIAHTHPETAERAIRTIWRERSSFRVTVDGVDVMRRVAFTDVAVLRPMQESLLRSCANDGELEMALRACESAGNDGWLDTQLDTWLGSSNLTDIARSLTITGLRLNATRGPDIFATPWLGAYLSPVARVASAAAERHAWMQQWLAAARDARDSVDVWRYATLASGLADSRFRQVWWPHGPCTESFGRFGAAFWRRSLTHAERVTKKRQATLFGLPAPSNDIARLLRDVR